MPLSRKKTADGRSFHYIRSAQAVTHQAKVSWILKTWPANQHHHPLPCLTLIFCRQECVLNLLVGFCTWRMAWSHAVEQTWIIDCFKEDQITCCCCTASISNALDTDHLFPRLEQWCPGEVTEAWTSVLHDIRYMLIGDPVEQKESGKHRLLKLDKGGYKYATSPCGEINGFN